MKSVFISYTAEDSEAALFLTNELRTRGIDVFFDYERMLSSGRFTRRMANEIKNRDCLLMLQSPSSMRSEQVQSELAFAQVNNVDILPILLESINITDTSEFAFLLHTRPIDLSNWDTNGSRAAIDSIEEQLWGEASNLVISVDNIRHVRELCTLHGHQSWVREIQFSHDGMLLASCANDNTIRLWDTRPRDFRGAPPRELTLIDSHQASVWGINFSHRGNLLASCSNDSSIHVWDVDDPTAPYEFTRFTDHHEPVYGVAFSPNRRYLGSASHDNTVHLRDIKSMDSSGMAESIVPLLHSSHVYSLDFSPDSRMVASASRDSTVRVWHIDPTVDLRKQDWSDPYVLIGHSSWVNTVCFSPKGSVLASTSHDCTIRLWETNVMKTFGLLTGHKDSVNYVSFSPDGRLLVSCAKDNTIRIWDITTQQEIHILHGHDRWVNSVIFSPDGKMIATASGDHTIKLWGITE